MLASTKPSLQQRRAGNELHRALGVLRNALLTVAVFSGVINLLMLGPAIYMLQVYDRVLASRNVTTLVLLSVLVLGALLFMSALEAVRTWVLVRVGARLDAQLHARVFTATYERNLWQRGSNTVQPVHDLNAVRQALTGVALLAAFDAPWLPIYLIVIFAMAPELGWLTLCGALALGALAALSERLTKPRLDEAQTYAMQSQQALNHHLRNVEVIEAMGMLPRIRERWFKLHRKQMQAQALASDRAAVLAGATKFLRTGLQSLVLGYGALLVLEGRLTAGMMIAASILAGRALAPVELLVGNWRQIVASRQAYRRLRELLDLHPAREQGMSLPRPLGQLSVEAAAAIAPGTQRQILRNLSFAVAPGEVVAIIGPSASGKSSLARLLVGIWPASAGSVRLDGATVFEWSKDQLGPHVGYLPQDIELFDGSVAENIARFGEVDADKVLAAARLVDLHELILRLPQGYDTPIGNEGNNVSAGQRQRIGLARAFYGAPSFVVLDEPNSNLDEAGEKALVDALRAAKAMGTTVILITHRFSTLSVVDKVLMLAEGTVAAYGPRDAVLKALQQAAAGAPVRQAGPMPPALPGLPQASDAVQGT